MPVVYVNIGSNLGNRKSYIDKALEEISDNFGHCCISGLVESEPWGFDSTNRFLNLGVSFLSDLDPEEILDILQRIEKRISPLSHRDSSGYYIDRAIDIDIMAIDYTKYFSKRLTLPHIHLFEREFFLNPLLELNPEWLKEYKQRHKA